jgi:hypothetical protein
MFGGLKYFTTFVDVIIKHLKQMEHTTIIEQEFDSNGNEIYHKSIKTTDATTKLIWWKAEYDSNGNQTYYLDVNKWWKAKYDSKGNQIEYTDGNIWWVRKFDDKGNVIDFSNSYGYSWVREFDDNGNIIFFRSNNYDDVHFDNRPRPPKSKKKRNFFSKLFG